MEVAVKKIIRWLASDPFCECALIAVGISLAIWVLVFGTKQIG
jgi:hypothetical protein